MSDEKRPERREEGRFHVSLSEEQLNADRSSVDMQQYANIGASSRRDEVQAELAAARNVQARHAEQREAREHRKRNRVKGRKNRRIFTLTWVIMVVLVSLTVSSYLISGSNDFLAVHRLEGTVTIELPEEKMTSEELADLLYKSHVIEKPEFFSLYCKIRTNMDYFSSGSFEIATNLDYEDIINQLQAGPDMGEEIQILFPEGITVLDLAQIFEDNGFYTAEEIEEYCDSRVFDWYDEVGEIPVNDRIYRLEGYLFPDTYQFFENDTIEALLERFLYNFQTRLSDEMREGIRESGYTLDEIVILASIIQAEAADEEDMGMISAILRNRLEHGEEHDIFSLDCDSTSYYPYRSSTAPDGYVSPYLTYASEGGVTGLPAGPICNPGLAALNAAIFPSEEGADYYYFCHDAYGTPYYAKTAEEHAENLAVAGLA